jgi:DNA primase
VERLAALRKHVVVAFDNDEAGRRGRADVEQALARARVPLSQASLPDDYKDVAEMPLEEAKEWLSSAALASDPQSLAPEEGKDVDECPF